MAGIQVPIEFVAQFGDALKGLDKFTKEVQKDVSSMQSNFNGLKTVLGALAGAFTVAKIIDGIQAITREAAESERVTTRLANALKAAGDFSEQNVQAFNDLADELARVSKFDDDVIKDQVALAKQFGLTNREVEKLIRAAVDLSAATGDDLNTSVRNLGQTLDGNAGRIAQIIPELQTLTAEQLRNGAAIEFVAKRYKDFAKNELNTFDGALTQVNKKFNDLAKAAGKTIVENETTVALLKQLTILLTGMTDFVNENRVALTTWVSDGIILAVNAVGILAQAIAELARIWEFLGSVIKVNVGLLAAFVAAKIEKDVKKSWNIATTAVREFSKEIKDQVKGRENVFDKMSMKAAEISVALEKVAQKGEVITKTTGKIKKGFDDQTVAAKRFNAEMKQNFEALVKDLEKVGESQLDILNEQYKRQLELINLEQDGAKRQILNDKLRIKYNEDLLKIVKEQVALVRANPFTGLFGPETPGGAAGLSLEGSKGVARGLSVAQSALGGAEGAKKLLGAAASAVGTALLGPAGEALGPLVEALSAGPDQVKKMVNEFLDALPVLIENVIKSIPVIIEVLADRLPDIIERLVDRAPEIIEALIRALPRLLPRLIALMPRIVWVLVKGAFRVVAEWIKGAGRFIGRIIQGAVKFVGEILKGAGRFVKKILDSVNPFKSGGGGGGFGLGGDKGLLGGRVIKGFLKGGGEQANDLQTTPGLAAKSGPSTLAVNVKVSKRELATTILDLNKLGYRLEPI